jgi:hypothetical protein
MANDALTRRDALKLAAAGVTGVSLSGWLPVLARAAAVAPPARPRRCILLWMDGGPSHKDTFDLKPGTKDGGTFGAIDTSVSGVQISEHFPQFAKQMKHVAVLRGMSTLEGAHGRARYYLHTGYREGSGGLVHPSLGAIVSAEKGRPEFPLPNYVSINNRSYGAGFLGPRHQPLIVPIPQRGVENLRPLADARHFAGRLDLLGELEAAFHREYRAPVGHAHRTTYQRAVALMQSKEARAFDLSREPEAVRRKYGATRFGEGCLLARRLVEAGVVFVEVTLGGWDTHQNNFERVRALSGEADPAMAALVGDLHDRGLLETTLVVWMGEFGRTPRITSRGGTPGRDHYPRAWSSLMIGGGVRGGQVVGKTDREGAAVVERRISALDYLATVCTQLGINYAKQNHTPIGRPLRLVDKGATPIKELLA